MTKKEAIKILETVDPTTVIDDNWDGYLEEQPIVIEALCSITKTFDYTVVLQIYEGYTIKDLLNDL
jgi:hypothetical protein